MKKLLLVLLMVIPLVGSARMFPSEIPIKAICWSGEGSTKEAITYHQEVLGEHPIGKGWVNDHSFATIMYNPVKPSWTFLSFHESDNGMVVCAITGGTQWEILSPGEDKILL